MAALTVGNKSSVEQYVGSLGTITHSHTVAAGTNRILLVASARAEVTGTPDITGITYNGSALTAVTNGDQNTGVTWERVQWWYLIGPSTGANNLVMTLGDSGEAANVTMDVADYSNHNGAAPVGNFRAYGSSVSSLNTGSIAYTDGDVIGAATIHGINGKTVSWTNATEYSDNDFEAFHQSTAFYTATGAGNITITATPSATEDRMALSAVRISPASATPVVESVSQIYPGGLVTVVISGYITTPLTAFCTLNGIGITLEAGASTTGCTFYAPAESTYLFGGSRASHRWNTNCTLTIASATDTANSTVQVTPPTSDQMDARSAASLVNAIDTYNSGVAVATGDDVYQYSSPADSFVPYPPTNDYTPLEPSFTLYTKFYDVSASTWSGLTTLAVGTSGLSLATADTTVTPGQVVRQTLTGGPFAGAITAAAIVYGSVTIPVTWAVVTSTTTDITIPDLTSFVAGGSCEQLPWYANFVIKLTAGAETAETPSTNQVVAPVPGDYGTVAAPPWTYATIGAQQMDNAYMYGSGTFTPETFGQSGGGSFKSMAFNLATQRWLQMTTWAVGVAGTGRRVIYATIRRGML